MKPVFFFLLLLPLLARAQETPLENLEAHCWSEAADEGSFLCQYLLLMGKLGGQWVEPELYAPGSEEKIWDQAHLACAQLGFSHASGYKLASADKPTLFVRLTAVGAAFTWNGTGSFIQHLKCD